ncbi:MAG: SPASM domain-containing protein [Actinobacteria bacterium]|nr:SPASM domain-containing protein [Actinomycetota bacterium]
MKVVYDPVYRFASSFDPQTGFYYRTNVKGEEGGDTGRDPLRASFPHLLDIGIMGHCVHGKAGYCLDSGVQCYQDGPGKYGPNMSLEDFKRIADQCENRVYQFALGGRGDPDQHEDFAEILAYCRHRGIVPNFTSSGLGFNARIIKLAQEYCGAVAISWYRAEHTLEAVNLLLEAGVKTNIHYVIGSNTIDGAIELLEEDAFPKGINRVIFLLHKPVGLGQRDNVLKIADDRAVRFFRMFNQEKYSERTGFDSCSVPGLLNLAPSIHPATIDTCEGARFSAYVSPDLKMLPCSFDQDYRWAVDLRQHTLQEAWESARFEDFRNRLGDGCPGCEQRELCLGGCPVVREIVLCDRIQIRVEGGAGC